MQVALESEASWRVESARRAVERAEAAVQRADAAAAAAAVAEAAAAGAGQQAEGTTLAEPPAAAEPPGAELAAEGAPAPVAAGPAEQPEGAAAGAEAPGQQAGAAAPVEAAAAEVPAPLSAEELAAAAERAAAEAANAAADAADAEAEAARALAEVNMPRLPLWVFATPPRPAAARDPAEEGEALEDPVAVARREAEAEGLLERGASVALDKMSQGRLHALRRHLLNPQLLTGPEFALAASAPRGLQRLRLAGFAGLRLAERGRLPPPGAWPRLAAVEFAAADAEARRGAVALLRSLQAGEGGVLRLPALRRWRVAEAGGWEGGKDAGTRDEAGEGEGEAQAEAAAEDEDEDVWVAGGAAA